MVRGIARGEVFPDGISVRNDATEFSTYLPCRFRPTWRAERRELSEILPRFFIFDLQLGEQTFGVYFNFSLPAFLGQPAAMVTNVVVVGSRSDVSVKCVTIHKCITAGGIILQNVITLIWNDHFIETSVQQKGNKLMYIRLLSYCLFFHMNTICR